MTTFTTSGSVAVFSTSGTAVSFTVAQSANSFAVSPYVTPGAHAASHGAGGSDPITTLGTVTTTLGTVTTLASTNATIATATITTGTVTTLSATNTATFGSAVSIALGGAASPTLRFTGDTNTGIYSPGADQVGISTAGTARVVVDGSGNVGIGTTSPSGPVHINTDSSTVVRVFQNSTDTSGPKIYMVKQRGSAASPTVVASGDSLGDIYFYGQDGSARQTAALIQAAVDATPGSGDMPGRLTFWTTADGASSVTERLRIDNAGLITGTGTSLGAWGSFAATLSGTGWAIGNGTITTYYCQIGKMVHYRGKLTLGSTSTTGSGALTLNLPVTATSSTAAMFGGVASFVDSGVAGYPGSFRLASTTTINFYTFNASGTYATEQSVIDTRPFTWGDTDYLYWNITYEAA